MTFRTLDDDGHLSGTVEIDNPTRSRRWGFGYSTRPTCKDSYSIESPDSPIHTGTIKQVRDAITEDRTFRSFQSGGAFYAKSWFHNGVRLFTQDVEDWLFDLDYQAAQ